MRLDAPLVVQLQSTAGNRAATAIVQRQPKIARKAPPTKSPVTPAPAVDRVQVYVVRDKAIGVGGELVPDLAAFKKKVMSTAVGNDWMLVLAIHGSEERLAAQSYPDWKKNAIYYEAKDLNALFDGDAAFVKWRDQYGPTSLSLVACQVTKSLEGVLVKNLTRTGKQPSRGLGE
ncbi:MAG: hypothetical protein QOJ69_2313, partial [Actinomycetota bacterium]|nr:hypothetical protein [Actinomycetota bacterium]